MVEIGTMPAWSFSVTDYAFPGQNVSIPSGASSGTITVKYYAENRGRAAEPNRRDTRPPGGQVGLVRRAGQH